MHYAVVIEKGERNYSAYVPDLPGCVSAGDTPGKKKEVKAEETARRSSFILKACEGAPIREPSSRVEYVEFENQSARAAFGGSRKSSFISAFYQIAV